jgi:hypothetical protein
VEKKKTEDIFCTVAIVRGITETRDEYFKRSTLVEKNDNLEKLDLDGRVELKWALNMRRSELH